MTTLNNTSPGGPDPHLLKSGMVLNGRYVIDRYLDQGGFGITYKGHDRTLDIDVAIKEYYPLGLVTRDTGSASIYTVGGSDSEAEFTAGRQQFIREARTLARFDGDPGIVGVKDDPDNSARLMKILPEDYTATASFALTRPERYSHDGSRRPVCGFSKASPLSFSLATAVSSFTPRSSAMRGTLIVPVSE